MRKRLTAALLCLCLCLTLFPTAAYAQEGSVTVNRAGEGLPGGGETPPPEETPGEETPDPAPEETPEETPPETPACTCETLCDGDSVNAACPVCGAEGADLTACRRLRP